MLAEAKAEECERRATEVENKIQQTIKERSDRMRDTLNNKLKESRVRMEEDFKKKEDDLKLQLEQEKRIWQAENAGDKPEAAAHPAPTPIKQDPQENQEQAQQQPQEQQQPATAPAVASTTAAGSAPDLSQLDDASIRQFLSSNATVKSIIAANIKKKLESENARMKTEYESKITSAREQAQLMESKKSTLRINMTENKLRSATAKLGVVETAANETPQKPVVEVWEIAKTTQPAPATPAAAPGTPAKVVQAAKQPATPAAVATPAAQAAQQSPLPATSLPAKPAVSGTPAQAGTNNPFTVPGAANSAAEAPNPFAAKIDPAAGAETQAQPAQPGQQPPKAQQPQQAQGQQAQQVRSGIPMPRGGGRGRGGAYVPPGQRGASGNQEGGAQAGRGGRGGHRGGRGGMNPGATDFQPGTKRPRGDSEVGGGAKRARGAH